MNINIIERAIEAILFAAGNAVPLSKISSAINQDNKTTRKLIHRLQDFYEQDKRGFRIIEVEGCYQMCTRGDYYKYIKAVVKVPQKITLTETQLETLSIISYKQPVTKAQIESIRGVRCDHVINKLIEYNLVCEKGRMAAPGRPLLFGTTDEFLKYFGLKSTKDLPEIEQQVIQKFEEEAAVDAEIELQEDKVDKEE